ncbi:hypothetical protein DFJ63DRAFT_284486 [Scheffersomyces coipomensis]|uniref:uncharacterized protein n=1 Tax=Scheffersomyces coipomensis TaxID=1788519 RepID=UPI00315CD246
MDSDKNLINDSSVSPQKEGVLYSIDPGSRRPHEYESSSTTASSSSDSPPVRSSLFHKLFQKDEDRSTPTEVYNIRVVFTALAASMAAIIIGYDGGFIGGTVSLQSFLQEFQLIDNENSTNIIANVISVFHVGCFFGALISYPFSYYLGRRLSLIIASVLITIGSGISLISSSKNGLGPIYAGRVISGISVGFSTNLTVVYISEISPPAIRGQLTSCYEIGWRIGDVVGFWISYGVNSHISNDSKLQWFIPFAIQLIPSGLFLLGSLVIKESPRWLFQVNKDEQAIKNLTWLRNLPEDHEYIIYEINQIKESIEYQRINVGLGLWDPFKEVFVTNRKLLKRLLITCTLFLFQNFLGIQSINYYSPIIFENLGIKGMNATLFSTGMFGVVKFICTFTYILFIVDTVGRRKSFMSSSTVCSICFWYIGTYLRVRESSSIPLADQKAGPAGTLAVVFMYIWIASFILAWSGGPFVVGSEIFDQNIRAFIQAINAAVSWIPIFLMARFTTQMIDSMHYGIYYLFASLSVISIPFVYFYLPETKGIALEDMDKLFNPDLKAREAHKIVLSQVRQQNKLNLHDKSLFKIDTNKSNSIKNIENIVHS